MAHYNINKNPHLQSMIMPTDNQFLQDNYEYEIMKLIEKEHELFSIQQQLQQENNTTNEESESISRSISNFVIKPFRIILIRHAERVDAVLGSDWSKKSFDRNGHYTKFSEHLPDSLPMRCYLHHYVIDVPLTNRGCIHAFKTGKALLFNGYEVDICYTSPSLRCIQSADHILNGMNRKKISMKLEPGLFECYLNDFKRTLCFMTKDELISNGYNIDKSYQSLIPFMRPHDNQFDYYQRSRFIMNVIIQRHQITGGTILIVGHAPSLEGLTRHLSGGKLQPEKLFDIARRVPFLAMTILEKNIIDNSWSFRTEPLQMDKKQSINESSQLSTSIPYHSAIQQQQQQLLSIQINSKEEQQNQNIRSRLSINSIDTKKVIKSSTAPNLPTSNSLSEMFRVI